MREHLYRGIPKDDSHRHFFADIWKDNCEGSFVYGSLIIDKDKYYICVSALCAINSCVNNGMTSMIEVIPETVGQYTGLTDKNGTKIFEGDILKYYVWGIFECFAVVRIGEYEQDGSGDAHPAIKIYGVYAEIERKCPLIKEDENYFPEYLKKSSLLRIGIDNFDLVDNIHDNPELLKGGDE